MNILLGKLFFNCGLVRQVLECASALALWDLMEPQESGTALTHSKTRVRPRQYLLGSRAVGMALWTREFSMAVGCVCAMVIALTATTNVAGQGTVFFYNYAPSVGLDAPVYDVGGFQPIQANQYCVAQLLAGPNADRLSAVGPVVSFAPGGGYWTGSLVRTIDSVAPGATAYLQVRVWSSLSGPTYEQVVQAGGLRGESSIFSVVTGGDTLGDTQPPSLPAFMTGLKSFALVGKNPVVPEPTLGLWLVMGIVLWIGRSLSWGRER